MLIRKEHLRKIVNGEATLAFRRWKRPTVKAGGRLRTVLGVLAIDDVQIVNESRITSADARRAGYDSLPQLLEELNQGRTGEVYRIRLRLEGDDPRIALREQSSLTKGEVETLKSQLDRWDAGKAGVWTRQVLNLIAQHPGLRAGELAALSGFEKEWLKTHVRKLKELGLTESLSPGYRVSTRGDAFLKRLV